MSDELVDVIEVEIKAPHRIRVMDVAKTPANADAIIRFTIMRRGCADHFYTTAPTRLYRDGDFLPENGYSA